MKKNMSRLGFTLIELLIVITIIGILAVVFVPTILNAPAKARDAARKADIANTMKGVEAGRLEALSIPNADNSTDVALATFAKYMPNGKLPVDPNTSNLAVKAAVCATSPVGKYCFVSWPITTPTGYAIFARIEGRNGNIACNNIIANAEPTLTATTGDCYGALSK